MNDKTGGEGRFLKENLYFQSVVADFCAYAESLTTPNSIPPFCGGWKNPTGIGDCTTCRLVLKLRRTGTLLVALAGSRHWFLRRHKTGESQPRLMQRRAHWWI